MSKNGTNNANNAGNDAAANNTATTEQVVHICPGAGATPIEVKWHKGLTYAEALKAADIKLQKGEVLVVGEVAMTNLKKTMEPGQTAVVDNAPSNGKIPA